MCALLTLLPAAPRAEERLDRVTLQLKWFHQFQFAGYYVAQARGFYREERLAVEIREGNPARTPAEVVLSGQAEFGVHTGGDVLYGRLQGLPLVALAVVFQHSPAVVVTRRADRLHRPADLVGRTLMMTREHGEANILAMFRREGIELDGDPARSVQTRPHSWNPADLAERRTDAISAYLTTEPAALRRAGVEVSILRPVEYGIDFYGDTLFTSEALLERSPELAQRFTRASMRGWSWAMAHPEEAADLILGLDSARGPRPTREALLEEARAMEELILPRLVEMGHMNPGRWERMAEEFRLQGLVSSTERVAGFVPVPREGRLLRTVLAASGAVALLAAVVLLWARQLRREVRLRTADLQREVALREAQSQELQASLRTNRAILSGIPDLIFINRRDGTYLDWHTRSQQDLAVPPEAFLGKKPSDLFPPEFAGRLQASFEAAIDQDRTQLLEYPLELGGQRRFFEARVVSLGEDTALTIVRDVSGERQARERLSLLGAAIEQAAEDVIITDAAGVIRYVNPAFERSTGWRAEEVLGQKPSILRSGRHDERFYRAIWDTLAAGRTWQGRFSNRTKDGRIILQDANIVAIRDGQGAPAGYVSTRHDVTERVEMETHLAQTQRMEAIGTLAGGIAHDFNNILAAIVGNAELGLGNAGENREVAEDLRSILQAAGRAGELVKQILSFSRQVADAVQPVQVATLLQESQKLLRATLPSSISFSSEIHTRALVEADPGELQRLIINLCTNAALAMRGTNGQLTLRLEELVPDEGARARHPGLAPGRFVQLTVADTGCGMTPEVKARIFEPFFTTRGAGGGTGLGLSIVHGVVKRLRGAIEVESEPGQGTTFRVLLPAKAPQAPAQGQAAPVPERGRGRLLVVDDEPMLARMLERNLTRLGYTVLAFTSSVEALQALEAAPGDVDALVTDLAMPQISGEELARRARAVRSDLPVLLCTGNRQEVSDERAAALGIAQVLEKPVDTARLSQALRQVLAGGSPL